MLVFLTLVADLAKFLVVLGQRLAQLFHFKIDVLHTGRFSLQSNGQLQ